MLLQRRLVLVGQGLLTLQHLLELLGRQRDGGDGRFGDRRRRSQERSARKSRLLEIAAKSACRLRPGDGANLVPQGVYPGRDVFTGQSELRALRFGFGMVDQHVGDADALHRDG